jgi:hypothetical protein
MERCSSSFPGTIPTETISLREHKIQISHNSSLRFELPASQQPFQEPPCKSHSRDI